MTEMGENRKEQQEGIKKWCEETSGVKGYFCHFVCGENVSKVHKYVKTSQNVHFKYMQLIA